MKALSCLVFIVILCACQSHLSGSRGTELGADGVSARQAELQISVEKVAEFSSKYYQFYSLSFFNNTDRWMEFAKINVRFPKANPQPTYLLGEKLRFYNEAAFRTLQTRYLRQEPYFTATAAAAMIVPAESAKKLDAMIRTPLNADEMEALLGSNRLGPFQEALPEGHLLKPFALAPGLSNSRWMVVRFPEDTDFESLTVDIEDIRGQKKSFEVIDRDFTIKEGEKARRDRNRPH